MIRHDTEWPNTAYSDAIDSIEMANYKPKNILRQLRSSKDDDADKERLFLNDEPAVLYQTDGCDTREYCVLETNSRGTWWPAARVVDHDEAKRILGEYDGEIEWLEQTLDEYDEIPEPDP